MNLRPYQERFFDAVSARYKAGVNRQLGVLATGLGKAVLFAMLRDRMGFSKKVMVLVHRDELATQAVKRIAHWNPGLMVGREMAHSYAAPMDTFIVASVPTLGRKGSRRIQEFHPDEFAAVISDEAHHSTSPQWKTVLTHFGLDKPGSDILSLGLTATPNRSDGTGLRLLFDEVVFDMNIREGIKQGYLVDLRCVRIETGTSLDNVKFTAGEFQQDELSDTVNTPYRNGVIVKEWYKHAAEKKSVAFTVDVQHALDLAAAFRAFAVNAEAIWGTDPERVAKLERHRRRETTVLCNCALLTEGYDDWEIECIIQAAPRGSALRYTQEIGRGTRIPDDVSRLYGSLHDARQAGFSISKDACLILDVVDNCRKHQLVTLPSLMGMPKDLDLQGRSATKAKEEFERVAKEFPTANLNDVKSLSALKSVAENFSLFQVSYPPEVARLTEFSWRSSGDGYMLAVNRESLVTITKDLRDEYAIKGTVNGTQVNHTAQNLAGAFNVADKAVTDLGGARGLLMRDVRWRNDPPTAGQIWYCKKLGISVPAGATKGQVSAAIDAAQRKQAAPQPAQEEYAGEF